MSPLPKSAEAQEIDRIMLELLGPLPVEPQSRYDEEWTRLDEARARDELRRQFPTGSEG